MLPAGSSFSQNFQGDSSKRQGKASPCAVQFRTSPHAVVPMFAADASRLEVQRLCPYHPVMTNIAMDAMEHDPFIDGLPMKNGDFPVRELLVITRWYHLSKCLGEIDLIASRGRLISAWPIPAKFGCCGNSWH